MTTPQEDEEKLYNNVLIRYLPDQQTLPENLEELLGKPFINKKEHGTLEDNVELYQFNILEFNNSAGYYDNCWIVKVQYEKEYYDHIYLKNLMIDIFGENIANMRSSTENTISVRLTGFVPTIDNSLSYYSTNTFPIEFPISILSYGRYLSNKTSKFLVQCKIKHYIFVEKSEYQAYLGNYYNYLTDQDKKFVRIIDTGEDFHLKNLGGTPVRNFILDYWLEEGYDRCWMLDDNINYYTRYNQGQKIRIYSDLIFSSIEQYIKPYENIGVCSHNLSGFTTNGRSRTIIVPNEKHYSSLLLLTHKQFRFKHKYNEDVLISIDYIIGGKHNFCFNHMLFDKNTSGSEVGGNTNTIYMDGTNEGYKKKYDYLYNELKRMYNHNLISIEGKFDKFIFSKKLKSKSISHVVNYKNIIIHNRQHFIPQINLLNLDDNLELR